MGGSQRRETTGGSAKGMARNCRVFGNSGSMSPVKVPVEVRTVRFLVFGQVDPFWVPRTGLVVSARRDKLVSFMVDGFRALRYPDADDDEYSVSGSWFLTLASLCSYISGSAGEPHLTQAVLGRS